MEFNYSFPAVKGVQAGKEYYISMVPLKLLSKLFPNEDDVVAPEYRAQRRINEMRIPEIKKYILENRETYVFSALSASIDGKFSFVESEHTNMGMLLVDMNSIFLINDGQHRKAAIEAAMIEDSSLGEESISIVFFADAGLARSQQMFTDLNKHAVKTSNSISTLYDTRDKLAVVTNNIINKIPFFRKFTDKEKDNLGKNSSNLFTLINIYKANQKIVHGECTDEDEEFLYNYWKLVSENIIEWNEVMNRQLTKKDLRENYIVTLAITILALGKLGSFFYDNRNYNINEYLPKLREIDWLRSNPDWKNRVISPKGKVQKQDEAVHLTCNKIKELIGIELSKDEQNREKMQRRKNGK